MLPEGVALAAPGNACRETFPAKIRPRPHRGSPPPRARGVPPRRRPGPRPAVRGVPPPAPGPSGGCPPRRGRASGPLLPPSRLRRPPGETARRLGPRRRPGPFRGHRAARRPAPGVCRRAARPGPPPAPRCARPGCAAAPAARARGVPPAPPSGAPPPRRGRCRRPGDSPPRCRLGPGCAGEGGSDPHRCVNGDRRPLSREFPTNCRGGVSEKTRKHGDGYSPRLNPKKHAVERRK